MISAFSGLCCLFFISWLQTLVTFLQEHTVIGKHFYAMVQHRMRTKRCKPLTDVTVLLTRYLFWKYNECINKTDTK